MYSLSRTQKPRAGFTLLEVMVVIVILGVLASLVVPNLLGNKEKADRQKAISDIVALENALDMYRLDNGRYPTTEQGLEALIQQPANMADSRNYRTGGYIKRLPKDPWGNDYQYLSPGEKGLFDVYTLGADGQEEPKSAVSVVSSSYSRAYACRAACRTESLLIVVVCFGEKPASDVTNFGQTFSISPRVNSIRTPNACKTDTSRSAME